MMFKEPEHIKIRLKYKKITQKKIVRKKRTSSRISEGKVAIIDTISISSG